MYKIEFQPGPDFLRVDLRGELSKPETRIEAWREIIERCRDDGITHLLVVQDSAGKNSEIDAFISSTGVVGLGLGGIKIAFVDIDAANHDANKFGELVGVNRGANARVFYEEAPAHDWLLSSDSI